MEAMFKQAESEDWRLSRGLAQVHYFFSKTWLVCALNAVENPKAEYSYLQW